MASTKKILEDEFNQTTANTKEDVDSMTAAERLYDSLNYSYGRKKERSNASYDKAISQQDNAALARGMQRSSYAGQIRANLLNQKVKAQNDIDSELIADYENRLHDIEQDELAEAWRQKEYEANRADAAFSQDMQTKQFEAGRADTAWEQAFQREQFDFSKMTSEQQIAYTTLQTIAANGGNASDALLAKAGISRADFNAMKKKATSSGGGAVKKTTTSETTLNPGITDKDVEEEPKAANKWISGAAPAIKSAITTAKNAEKMDTISNLSTVFALANMAGIANPTKGLTSNSTTDKLKKK